MEYNRTILVVDDEENIRKLISLIVNAEGYHVIEAVNGIDAWEKLCKNNVEMVITDFNMPKVDGVQLVRKIRTIPEYNLMPVIMISGVRELMKKECLEVGVNEWIGKPFLPKHLINVIKILQHQKTLVKI